MRFEAYVAARYLRGKRKNRFISLITLISILGVSVGVIALIVVMSVMTGFQEALRETIIGNRSHLFVYDHFGRPMENPTETGRVLREFSPHIIATAPRMDVEALLQSTSSRGVKRYKGGFIMGIDPEQETHVTQLADNLTTERGRTFGGGQLPGDKEIVLGYILARQLHVGIGDSIAVYTPRARVGPTGVSFTPMWLTVSGIAQAQMSEFDTFYGWVNLDTAAMLTRREGVDGVHCKLTDPFLASDIARKIEDALPYRAETWYQSQQQFFDALRQEKLVMFIILVFIVLVAAFNITSTLIMVVMEKRRDIGILRTIGVSTRSVLLLFMLEGLFIGLGGTLIGVVTGSLLAYNINAVATVIANLMGVPLWDTTIYYFDRVPSKVVPRDVAIITVSAVILTFISTLYPAWSASRVDPVDALRNE